jgi:hypothetical protein
MKVKHITLEHLQRLQHPLKSKRQLDAEIREALEEKDGWAIWDVFDADGRRMGDVLARSEREALGKTGTLLTVSARKHST